MIQRARTMRHDKTDTERRFWNVVRNRSIGGFKFVRQLPIDPFIADFVCRETMLIVEIDGSQHAESAEDARRTRLLNGRGYSVLRFWNYEILDDLDSVRDTLRAVLAGDVPSPGWRYSPATLSPEGRGEAAAPVQPSGVRK